MKKLLFVIALLLPTLAQADSQRNPCYVNSNGGCTPVSSSAPLPVTNTPSGNQTVNIDQTTQGTTNGVAILGNGYPYGATPITGNGSGTTGAVVGTLAAVVGKTTYICGFDVSAVGGTATVAPITVAGLVGSSMIYRFSSTAAGATLSKIYTPCIPASAANTAITVTTTANGTATGVNVSSWGYQQ